MITIRARMSITLGHGAAGQKQDPSTKYEDADKGGGQLTNMLECTFLCNRSIMARLHIYINIYIYKSKYIYIYIQEHLIVPL